MLKFSVGVRIANKSCYCTVGKRSEDWLCGRRGSTAMSAVDSERGQGTAPPK